MAAAPATVAARRGDAALAVAPTPPLSLDAVAADWQRALDAAQRALGAAGHSLPSGELEQRRAALVLERRDAAAQLVQLGRAARVALVPWLSPVPVSVGMLGLGENVKACVFDLDGVLTDSGVLHAAAWAEVFDSLLLRLSEQTGRHFVPFDRVGDYRAYIDGRPRREGIHAFLASRGIHLPEGRADDSAAAETANGLARHKGEALELALSRRSALALEGARRYLEAAGHAGLGRAVVSASASTLAILEQSGLATLVDVRIDAETIRVEGLRSRPAPDVLLTACRLLAVEPSDVVACTCTPDGVVGARAAGLAVVGVGDESLRWYGAERVAPSLLDLLDSRLRTA
jgi:beta-phosphoglucomutase-like phosphatase (HAD superfamily)